MKIIALEEHLVTPAVRDAWGRLPAERQDASVAAFNQGQVARRLEELTDRRLRDMDEVGVDVQVLSLTTPGTQGLAAADAVPLARDANDLIGATVAGRPDRFGGFATLPTPDPEAAARELERAVSTLGLAGAMLCGRTGDRNMDHPDFRVLYDAAAALQVPLYIHPQIPTRPVRDAYYSGYGRDVDAILATGGIGWHFETGVQLLRLVVAGTFDRHPGLQVIVGHWGEVVLFYLERVQVMQQFGLRLDRPLADYFRQNVYYTPSGIFSPRYLRQTIDLVGAERVMYSTDYPFRYEPGRVARTFLEQADLPVDDRERIAHGNWERLTVRPPARA